MFLVAPIPTTLIIRAHTHILGQARTAHTTMALLHIQLITLRAVILLQSQSMKRRVTQSCGYVWVTGSHSHNYYADVRL